MNYIKYYCTKFILYMENCLYINKYNHNKDNDEEYEFLINPNKDKV